MRLHDRFQVVAARRRLAGATCDCYWHWIVEFLRYSRLGERWRSPAELAEGEVEAFLNHIARDLRLSASTQNQALCALVFLYHQVLRGELGAEHLGRFAAERARRPQRAPTVLGTGEVARLEQGWDIRQVQSLLGHSSVKTTMRYTHVMNRPCVAVRSPLDRLEVFAPGEVGR